MRKNKGFYEEDCKDLKPPFYLLNHELFVEFLEGDNVCLKISSSEMAEVLFDFLEKGGVEWESHEGVVSKKETFFDLSPVYDYYGDYIGSRSTCYYLTKRKNSKLKRRLRVIGLLEAIEQDRKIIIFDLAEFRKLKQKRSEQEYLKRIDYSFLEILEQNKKLWEALSYLEKKVEELSVSIKAELKYILKGDKNEL